MIDQRRMTNQRGWRRGLWIAAAALAALVGCATDPPPAPTTAPVGVQLRRLEPALRQNRFSILSSFEADADAVFVEAPPVTVEPDPQWAHGGDRALRVPAGAREIRLNLASLMLGRAFPGDWTFAGVWVGARHPVRLTITREVKGALRGRDSIDLAPNQWTPALVDIVARTPAQDSDPGVLVLRAQDDSPLPALWLDDVLVLDNARTFVSADPDAPAAVPTWEIRRRGNTIEVLALPRFNVDLGAPIGDPQSLEVCEANAMRARFESADASRAVTLYVDGRAYWDGQYKPVGSIGLSNRELSAQHQAPARLSVDPRLGKIDRSTPGDANHDGYNERRGAYQFRAEGARLQVVLSPATDQLINPILEVTGLPQGKLVVTAEGRLIESALRLDDGTVLVEIPVRLTRPTSVELRVKSD